jgi:hypothetical protein
MQTNKSCRRTYRACKLDNPSSILICNLVDPEEWRILFTCRMEKTRSLVRSSLVMEKVVRESKKQHNLRSSMNRCTEEQSEVAPALLFRCFALRELLARRLRDFEWNGRNDDLASNCEKFHAATAIDHLA